MVPGEIILKKEDIICNSGRKSVRIEVKNTGDRPIQVGSHFHFFEVNKMLDFDRAKALGMRLNIPSTTAVRFEPGEQKQVILVEISGKRRIFGFNNLTDGLVTDPNIRASSLTKAKQKGFKGA